MKIATKLKQKIETKRRIKRTNLPLTHKVIEISNLSSDMLRNAESILPHVREFIAKTNLRVIKEQKHDFNPQGTTLIFLLSSSHLAVHTWPEKGYLHLDLFTCASLPDNGFLIEELKEIFETNRGDIKIKEIRYGPKNKL